jgi:quercetin dioxygenase-like cupin family protein
MALPRLIPISERYYAYVFEKAGDELPLHAHPFTHDTIVAVGRIEWFTGRRRETVEAWHVITFPAGVEHGIVALSDGATILQCNKIEW